MSEVLPEIHHPISDSEMLFLP
eukprot:COSAG01_NODE_55106_length_327_cov_0.912281_1_plen_21_part_10